MFEQVVDGLIFAIFSYYVILNLVLSEEPRQNFYNLMVATSQFISVVFLAGSPVETFGERLRSIAYDHEDMVPGLHVIASVIEWLEEKFLDFIDEDSY